MEAGVDVEGVPCVELSDLETFGNTTVGVWISRDELLCGLLHCEYSTVGLPVLASLDDDLAGGLVG